MDEQMAMDERNVRFSMLLRHNLHLEMAKNKKNKHLIEKKCKLFCGFKNYL